MSYRVRRSRSTGVAVGQVGAAGVAGLDGDRLLGGGLARMGARLQLRLRALATVARAGTPYGLVLSPCEGGMPELPLVLRVVFSSRTVIRRSITVNITLSTASTPSGTLPALRSVAM